MNKQELIGKLTKLVEMPSEIEGYDFDYGHDFGIRRAISLAKQLDEQQVPSNEPEKPVVPQFIADWLEVCKDNLALSLANSMNNVVMRTNNQPNKTIHWIAKNSETFAKAWIYGYEVEKEKLYTVEIPNPNSAGGKLVLSKQQSTGKLILEMLNSDINKPKYLHLTEAEIKEDFAWAWQFAKEVEE